MRTKKQFVEDHKKLWGYIVSVLQHQKQNYGSEPVDINSVKEIGYITLFPERRKSPFCLCFGCEWSLRGVDHKRSVLCHRCLLDVKNEFASLCLDGLWPRIHAAYSIDMQIEIAEKIRDFPIRKTINKRGRV